MENENLEASGSQRSEWINMKPLGTCHYQPPIPVDRLFRLQEWFAEALLLKDTVVLWFNLTGYNQFDAVEDRLASRCWVGTSTDVLIDGHTIDRTKTETVDSADHEPGQVKRRSSPNLSCFHIFPRVT